MDHDPIEAHHRCLPRTLSNQQQVTTVALNRVQALQDSLKTLDRPEIHKKFVIRCELACRGGLFNMAN